MNTQTNTRRGDFPMTAGEDLTGKEGYLVAVTNDSGAVATLPANADDVPAGVLVEEAEADATATVRPLEPAQLVRVKLTGTCNPGDKLFLNVGGKVSTLPAAADVYRCVGIAEEAGVADQNVLMRPFPGGTVTVSA